MELEESVYIPPSNKKRKYVKMDIQVTAKRSVLFLSYHGYQVLV